MSFGRWLLIHSFSIFLVSLLILGYIYRQPLKLEQVYNQLLQQPEKFKHAVRSDEQTETPDAQTVTQSPQVESGAKTAQIEEQPDVITQAPSSLERDFPPTVSETSIELNDRLLAARKAYWEKDYPLAIQHYQTLIEEDDSNPDYDGELGNIYYSLNDYEKAARHFYAAATILIAQDKYQQARALVPPISAMNHDLGDQIERDLGQR